ncbi:MAG: DUF4358 domain-containing protein [Clostridia bacterium]|nr:DUF4358 domain-containing protein [Clostridia bacterium]
MKRLLALILAALTCLCACGGQEDSGEKTDGKAFPEDITCYEIMRAAVEAVHFSEDGSEEGSDTYLPENDNFDDFEMGLWADSSFEGCEEYELLTDYAVLYLPHAYVTYEVAVFEAENEEDAEKLLKVLERRKETMAAGDKGFYDANFESVMDDSLTYRDGNYAIMIITGDAETSKAAVDALKK